MSVLCNIENMFVHIPIVFPLLCNIQSEFSLVCCLNFTLTAFCIYNLQVSLGFQNCKVDVA